MWPANRAQVRESRAGGLSCGVQGSHEVVERACGLVLPEPAVGCQTQLSQRALFSDSAAGTFLTLASGHFPVTEAVAVKAGANRRAAV